MKFLNPPIPHIAAGDIFETCVENYRDKKKRHRLLSCKQLVETDTESYQQLVPQEIDKYLPSKLPNDVLASELATLYDEKFAKAGTVGRPYYDSIMAQVERGICPICGIRMVATLDHYLPKSKIPTLAVTPSNLIPSCRDCNMDKRTDFVLDPRKTPIHLYYDRLPNEPWLHVNIGTELEVTYYISCPESWDEALRSRVGRHLEVYHLHNLYSAHAAGEISDNKHMWRKLYQLGSKKTLLESISEMRISSEENDLNSWKAALYRGLEKDIHKLATWLQQESLQSV